MASTCSARVQTTCSVQHHHHVASSWGIRVPQPIRQAAFASAFEQRGNCRLRTTACRAADQPEFNIVSSEKSAPSAPLSPAPALPPMPVSPARIGEVVRGCRGVMRELQGLDFAQREVRSYISAAQRVPPGQDAANLPKAREALEKLLQVDVEGVPLPIAKFSESDMAGLVLTEVMLSDLWKWRRRGGGVDIDGNEFVRPFESALEEIQNFKKEDIDRVTSSLLDSLPASIMSDADKTQLTGGMQKLAVNALSGAVWGSLVLGLAALAALNFLKG